MSVVQESYTGTLTGKNTADKIPKDIQGMLERGELPSMEETARIVGEAIEEYHDRKHKGLKEQGEELITPNSLMAHCARYDDRAPIDINAARKLALRPDEALVRNNGIRKNNRLYDGPGLETHIGEKVKIRFNSFDMKELLVTDKETDEVICIAGLAAKMAYGDTEDPVMIEGEKRKKRQKRTAKERAAMMMDKEAVPSPRSISSSDWEEATNGKVVALSQDRIVQKIAKEPEEDGWTLSESEKQRMFALVDELQKTAN